MTKLTHFLKLWPFHNLIIKRVFTYRDFWNWNTVSAPFDWSFLEHPPTQELDKLLDIECPFTVELGTKCYVDFWGSEEDL